MFCTGLDKELKRSRTRIAKWRSYTCSVGMHAQPHGALQQQLAFQAGEV